MKIETGYARSLREEQDRIWACVEKSERAFKNNPSEYNQRCIDHHMRRMGECIAKYDEEMAA